ncbi:MAG: hypothetical protein PUP91_18510 [Rhizonema sp. PD37]|nr:hypothetical protein [Rhizonema sp. PD37]
MMLTLNFRQDGTLGDALGSHSQEHRIEIWVKIVNTPLKAVKMAHTNDSKSDLKEF